MKRKVKQMKQNKQTRIKHTDADYKALSLTYSIMQELEQEDLQR